MSCESYHHSRLIPPPLQVWFEAGDAFEGTLIPNTNLHLLKSQKSKPLPLPIEKPYHLWLEHSSTMEKLLEPSVVDQLRELHGSWTRVGQSKDSTLMRLSKHDDCSTIFILIKEEVRRCEERIINKQTF